MASRTRRRTGDGGRAVLAFIDTMELGARLERRGLFVDLAHATAEDRDRMLALAAYKRRVAQEAVADADGLEKAAHMLRWL